MKWEYQYSTVHIITCAYRHTVRCKLGKGEIRVFFLCRTLLFCSPVFFFPSSQLSCLVGIRESAGSPVHTLSIAYLEKIVSDHGDE